MHVCIVQWQNYHTPVHKESQTVHIGDFCMGFGVKYTLQGIKFFGHPTVYTYSAIQKVPVMHKSGQAKCRISASILHMAVQTIAGHMQNDHT
jgi:hypothetical protein